VPERERDGGEKHRTAHTEDARREREQCAPERDLLRDDDAERQEKRDVTGELLRADVRERRVFNG